MYFSLREGAVIFVNACLRCNRCGPETCMLGHSEIISDWDVQCMNV